jgi:type IV fimbrial biogenesis protein FimT
MLSRPAPAAAAASGRRCQVCSGAGNRRRRGRGFTFIEVLIAITLGAVLLALGTPAFGTWVRNTQVRTVAESLQNGLRTAQAEAVRRNRQVVFLLTTAEPGLGATASANGLNWVIRWLPLPGDTVNGAAPANEPFVQGGALAEVAAGVGISGPAAVCFNALGRRVANAATGVAGAACTVDAAAPLALYEITRAGADRPLRVSVALGGQVRLCDPARTLGETTPDGCPA